MKVGDRIKSRRKELELSVEEVAKRIGKSKATVYRYESDDIENFPFTVLEPLAKVLETTPGDLMGWRKEEKPETGLDDQIHTIAAHADRPLTEEEMDEVMEYAKYIIAKHSKK